ncbi:DUF3800 domain-containing protein [Rhodococcus aetherivorans]|uniref:DUF3800 domain-containing protein n=1 Tax=Rhodococcus aetherivorans TaxID=191292 RepID=UPI00366DC707
MLLAYVDESYDKERYWIASVVCPSECVIPLTTALDNVVATAVNAHECLDARAELHGHALFHGKEDWEGLAKLHRARIGVYNDAFEALRSFPDVKIFIRGIDRVRQQQRYATVQHPHEVVLGHLLERLDEYAESKNTPLLVIADEIDNEKTHRTNLWAYQRYSTKGYRARRLTQIADTIHFAPSSSSRLLQIVDLVAYLHYRMNSKRDRNEKAIRANEALMQHIAPQIMHNFCWYP